MTTTLTLRIGDLPVNRLGYGAMRVCGPNIWGHRATGHTHTVCCVALSSLA